MQINSIANNMTVQNKYSSRNTANADFRSIMAGNAENGSSHIVYLKKDDMLYSGGNGTGLSFYLKYAEDSTEDDPKVLARGVDENGNEFEQTISVKDVNPRNATVVEMHALEAVSGAPKRNGLTSLPMGSENVGLNYKQDFIEAFKKNIADMNMLGEYGIAQEYSKLLSFYEDYVSNSGLNKDYSGTIGWSSISLLEKMDFSKMESGNNGYTADVSNLKEVETKNYKLVPETEIGGLRILVNGESAGVYKLEHLKIQVDSQTGTKVLISDFSAYGSGWYDAIPVDAELENALSEAMGVDEVPHKSLEGYYIGIHAETGIRYLMRPGDEGRGGKVLLCNEADEAKYKALGAEYASRYPNLVTSLEWGLFYASLEIRGMAHRGANGIVTTHPDNISYNDNDDPKKNWSAKIDEQTWAFLLGWFKNHRLNSSEMDKFKYWNEIFEAVGGNYERVWSDEEERQGYLYQ